MSTRTRKSSPLLLATLAAVTAGALVLACSATPSSSAKVTVHGASAADFAATLGGVNPVFERRCGSFDCHGNPSQALRIYSQNGLRLPNEAGILPGGAATTPDEVFANYRSILAVEPEETNAVVLGGNPYSLLILKKPLLIETHKGGTVMIKGDDTEKCITSWLSGSVDKNACTAGAQLP